MKKRDIISRFFDLKLFHLFVLFELKQNDEITTFCFHLLLSFQGLKNFWIFCLFPSVQLIIMINIISSKLSLIHQYLLFLIVELRVICHQPFLSIFYYFTQKFSHLLNFLYFPWLDIELYQIIKTDFFEKTRWDFWVLDKSFQL